MREVVVADALLQFWLLGYEFPTTLMLFTLDAIYILTTQKKGKICITESVLSCPSVCLSVD